MEHDIQGQQPTSSDCTDNQNETPFQRASSLSLRFLDEDKFERLRSFFNEILKERATLIKNNQTAICVIAFVATGRQFIKIAATDLANTDTQLTNAEEIRTEFEAMKISFDHLLKYLNETLAQGDADDGNNSKRLRQAFKEEQFKDFFDKAWKHLKEFLKILKYGINQLLKKKAANDCTLKVSVISLIGCAGLSLKTAINEGSVAAALSSSNYFAFPVFAISLYYSYTCWGEKSKYDKALEVYKETRNEAFKSLEGLNLAHTRLLVAENEMFLDECASALNELLSSEIYSRASS